MAFIVPEAELDIKATPGGGPGGQHVNRSATRIEVTWDVAASPSLTDEQRTRLLAQLASKLDGDGRLRVVATEHRSQRRNLTAAIARLQELVEAALEVPKPRKATKPSRAAVERRLTQKRQRGARKRERREPPPED